MERDDLIVNDSYALNSHHSEEAGAKIRKNIVKVTIILTLITVVEVFIGATVKKEPGMLWSFVIFGFVALTLVKARYIVLEFMHLGDERQTPTAGVADATATVWSAAPGLAKNPSAI